MILDSENRAIKIAVILPCFRSRTHVLDVIASIGKEIDIIFAVDDCCPEGTGRHILESCSDPRVRVLFHEKNQGVGGAMITGYLSALEAGIDIVVKVDSDGQMDPMLIPSLINPIFMGRADYVKGNRFYNPDDVRSMPFARWIGSIGLSFITKLSSGYWDIFDPCNGFTAIHRTALSLVPLHKLARRYFFETDMLFRLNLAGAVVSDFPMTAKYAHEKSGLSPIKTVFEFSIRHANVFIKRIMYRYFLRDFSYGSLCLITGFCMTLFGIIYGAAAWWQAAHIGKMSAPGTVMLSALPIFMGVQFLLSFIAQDQNSIPRVPLQILSVNRAQ